MMKINYNIMKLLQPGSIGLFSDDYGFNEFVVDRLDKFEGPLFITQNNGPFNFFIPLDTSSKESFIKSILTMLTDEEIKEIIKYA